MPTYSFECGCGASRDVVRPMRLSGKGCKCRECGRLMQRVYRVPQVIDDQLKAGATVERLPAFPHPSGDPRRVPVVDSKSGKKRLLADINASRHLEARLDGKKLALD